MGRRVSGVRTRVRIPRVELVTSPAAGADWSTTVPGGHVWTPMLVTGQLVTSAVVANRVVGLNVTVDGALVGNLGPVTAQAASGTVRYTWGDAMAYASATSRVGSALPELRLGPGAILASTTALIDVGDQWSSVSIFIWDEWIHGGVIDLDRLDLEVLGVIAPGEA